MIWLGCALMMVMTSLAMAPARAAGESQPPRTLWKAFPLHSRQQQARSNHPQPDEPSSSRSSSIPDKLFVAAAVAVAVIVLAALSWLMMSRRPRDLASGLRDHSDEIAFAGLAVVVGIGIGLFAGLYL